MRRLKRRTLRELRTAAWCAHSCAGCCCCCCCCLLDASAAALARVPLAQTRDECRPTNTLGFKSLQGFGIKNMDAGYPKTLTLGNSRIQNSSKSEILKQKIAMQITLSQQADKKRCSCRMIIGCWTFSCCLTQEIVNLRARAREQTTQSIYSAKYREHGALAAFATDCTMLHDEQYARSDGRVGRGCRRGVGWRSDEETTGRA